MQKTGFRSIFLLILSAMTSVVLYAQHASDTSSMQNLLQARHYTFTAQYAQPLSGRQINLTTLYTLTITKDSLICDLPYFGVAYTAPINPAENEMHFISNHFDYAVMPAKHGRYIVSIKPNDRAAVSQMFLSVSKKGYASLQVNPTNKQAISYYGTVEETVRVKK